MNNKPKTYKSWLLEKFPDRYLGHGLSSDYSEESWNAASEATRAEYEEKIKAMQAEIDKRDAAIKEIAPWLAASLDGKECVEYRDACNAIMAIDIQNEDLNQRGEDE